MSLWLQVRQLFGLAGDHMESDNHVELLLANTIAKLVVGMKHYIGDEA